MKKIRCISKDSKGGEKLPLFPLAREEGGVAEVQGQGENMEKRRGKKGKSMSQGEEECQR